MRDDLFPNVYSNIALKISDNGEYREVIVNAGFLNHIYGLLNHLNNHPKTYRHYVQTVQ
jgi:hypothetical protein